MMTIKKFFFVSVCVSVYLQPLPVEAQDATVYTTTGNAAKQLEQTSVPVAKTSMTTGALILKPTEKIQRMDGFGFAITYSSCFNLLKMSKADRLAFLTKTYSETEGYGVSYARISIGCSDFSSREYTLCDTKELENFSLSSDEVNYVIPILKEILTINPKVKIIATPWTCPTWMKVDDLTKKTAYSSWTGGHLNPDYYQDYANYFVKFINVFKDNGISVYAVSPQNEPLNAGNCASTYMPAEEETNFVKILAATFKRNDLNTKIYIYDHNYDKFTYPVQVFNALGSDYEGSEYVVGSAFHDYSGSNTVLGSMHTKFPDKDILFSESSIGTWNDGHNLATRLIDDMKNVTLGTVNKYCNAVIVWNFMLDDKMGPNLDGGCQTCYGAVDINSNDYRTLTYNSHYFIICHMSCVVRPNAVCIKTNDYVQTGLTYSAFLNPDGTLAVVLLNENSGALTVPLSDGTHRLTVSVPGRSVMSCKWAGDGYSGISGVQVEKKIKNNYYTLQGIKTNKIQKNGIYIVDGEKVVFK